nr:naringenin 8-dimethylallyltransferase 2, chloroplastic-like [Arachis hypogaea]
MTAAVQISHDSNTFGKTNTTDDGCRGSYAKRGLWCNNRNLTKEYSIRRSLQYNSKLHYKGIEGGSSRSDKFEKKYLMNASSGESYESELKSHDESKSTLESIRNALNSFVKFTRLYAFVGVTSGALSSSLLAVDTFSDISPVLFLKGFLQYMIPVLCMHQYVMGANQLADVEIDKINKPYLPLASGDYSYTRGVIIVGFCLLSSIGLTWMVGSKPLLWTNLITAVLTSAYAFNLPLLRWKRSTILTIISSTITLLTTFNLGAFLHMKTFVLKQAAVYPRSLLLGCLVMGCFYSVISVSKDLADVEGDKALGLKTLAIRLGVKKVFWLCISLIQMAYGVAITLGALSPSLWSKIFTVLAHAIMVLVVWNHASSVDLSNKDSLQAFHMFVFKLVYVENILVLFVR